MTIAFRTADLSDVNLLVSLNKALHKHEGTAYDTNRAHSAFTGFIGHPELGAIWMICDDGVPIGYIVMNRGYSIQFGGPYALVDEMYLEDKYRDRGIGRQSLEFMEEHCRFSNMTALYLEITKENMAGREFYKHMGFEHREKYTTMVKPLN